MLGQKVFVYSFIFYCVGAEQEASKLNDGNPVYAVVRKTLRATARSCMVSVNASEADLEYLRMDPPYPEKSSCILTCLLEKIGIVNNNKYAKAGFMTTVIPLVFRNTKKLQHMKDVSEKCDKELTCSCEWSAYHDLNTNPLLLLNVLLARSMVNDQHLSPCLLGNEITTCIFKYAPELQFNKQHTTR